MALPKNRYACMSDLQAYFKKMDLLGGLTIPEQEELRKNIGIGKVGEEGEAGQLKPLRITYEELWEKVTTNTIATGARYIITDFKSIYPFGVIVNNVEITGGLGIAQTPLSPTYELLVTGIDKNKLDSRAYIVGKNWEIEYDVTKRILEDGVTTKGRITWLRDRNGNSAFYDFKSIKFRRTKDSLRLTTINIPDNYIDLYTFSTISNDWIVTDSSETSLIEYNELKLNCWNNVFLGITANNIFEPEFRRNTFIYGCKDSHFLWQTTDNLFNEEVRYLTGALNNWVFNIGNTEIATSITKTIHKVNDKTIVSFLDPITYSHQIIIL